MKNELDDETRDMATEYVAGTLPAADLERFEAELARSEALRAEVHSLQGVAEDLLHVVPEGTPSGDLWARVQSKIRGSSSMQGEAVQPWKNWDETSPPSTDLPGERLAGMFLARGARTEWEATSTEGVDAMRLFVDKDADRVTMLVRMAPGTSYPAHRHAGPEECYVLEGDLSVGDSVEMHAGDYQRMDRGSVHEVQSTKGGCLLFLQSSLRDELVA